MTAAQKLTYWCIKKTLGEKPEAVISFSKRNPWLRNRLRQILLRYLLDKRAFHYLEQYIALFPNFKAVFSLRYQVIAYYYQARYSDVVALLEASPQGVSPQFVARYLSLSYFMKGENTAAVEVLDSAPEPQRLSGLKERFNAVRTFRSSHIPSKKRVAHLAWHYLPEDSGNAGDKLLPETVQKSFQARYPQLLFDNYHIHQHVDREQVERLNQYVGIIIGGGGLVYPASAPSFQSGWQWNISRENLAGLKVPMAFFAVGYNSFRADSRPSEKMIRHLTLCAEKSVYLGFRHLGDVRIMQEILPDMLAGKVRYQPCPTTLLKQLYPGLTDLQKEPFISLNFAYDRFDERYRGRYRQVLSSMAGIITHLKTRAEVVYYAHSPGDKQFITHLKKGHGISLKCVELYKSTPAEIVQAYSKPYLSLGMRGHAGLIPFGAGTIPIGLVAHRKVSAFFEDIGRPDLAIDIHETSFSSMLEAKINESLDMRTTLEEALQKKQQTMWQLTNDNLDLLPF